MHMLCRTRVQDFATWLAIFESHAEAHVAAGLHRTHLWQDADDPNDVHFVFRIEDRARAEAFLHAPESAQAGQEAGVIEGAYRFVEDVVA